jgi:hypothetical protein
MVSFADHQDTRATKLATHDGALAEPQAKRAVAAALGGPASENGRLCRGDGAPRTGRPRRPSVLELAILYPHPLDRFRDICTRYDPDGVFRNAYAPRVLGFPATRCQP